VDNPLDNVQEDKVTLFRTFHGLLMSGTRQREMEREDNIMQILENNAEVLRKQILFNVFHL
jgi:hypothetical protein